ncbi:Polysaccharide pyruvyl transferase family protein WcaK [Rhizobium mongolense subsp. loessense]|uniref:Polysaccharide pyruvyl transferase family protein WcaK n=1 Tax=Rhizobium mongolense subsp. loessense TaxID=158890 RepID=A0A1G4SHM3_9HYPH|nr:polysaccharide pyruvyl transferase family protein [Rhizobium mongolense]SCW68427.1 Polysaccharide pyruvyl transferase family protein WcaK [Rhizobium mongolense subsp. loessense]
MSRMPFKIVVFNVKYSENLGDGILALCIEHGLSQTGGGIEVETVDLAGRHGFGGANSGRRRHLLKLLQRLPKPARRLAVGFVVGRALRRLRGEWERKIAAADAVVIGGGNLFQDDDLNFPLKIGTVLDCVRRFDRPLAIYAVGVSSDWSVPARRLFARIGGVRLLHVSVRDRFAYDSWRRHFPVGPVPDIIPDPGLLIAQIADTTRVPSAGTTVAICVTEPVVLTRHASQTGPIPLGDAVGYHKLVNALIEDGFSVMLFCNGATEDHIFARTIVNEGSMVRHLTSGLLHLADRPADVGELLELLNAADAIVSHRLHACIAAYSLRIAHVGLSWDKKVEGFFRSVGREAYFVDEEYVTVSEIPALLKAALAQGIDQERYNLTMDCAETGMRRLRFALRPGLVSEYPMSDDVRGIAIGPR